jgi:hypothetical protein
MGILVNHLKKSSLLTKCTIEHLVKMMCLSCPMFLVKIDILLINIDILIKLNPLKSHDFN